MGRLAQHHVNMLCACRTMSNTGRRHDATLAQRKRASETARPKTPCGNPGRQLGPERQSGRAGLLGPQQPCAVVVVRGGALGARIASRPLGALGCIDDPTASQARQCTRAQKVGAVALEEDPVLPMTLGMTPSRARHAPGSPQTFSVGHLCNCGALLAP